MTNISHYPHSLNTKFYAVSLYRNGNPISLVCRRYKCSKASLMRWNKKFDGTKESLIDKSYQYIVIDKTYHERFIYYYKEQSSYSTIGSIKHTIRYFRYKPQTICPKIHIHN